MKYQHGKHRPAQKLQFTRKTAGIALWAVGIGAGIFGGDYGMPMALALFVAGVFLLVSSPPAKR